MRIIISSSRRAAWEATPRGITGLTTVFIREFVAVTRAHSWTYYVIAVICVINYIVAKCGMVFF